MMYCLPVADGDDENYGGRADDHAQSGEREAGLAGAKAVDGEPGNFAEHHGLPGAGHLSFKGLRVDRSGAICPYRMPQGEDGIPNRAARRGFVIELREFEA